MSEVFNRLPREYRIEDELRQYSHLLKYLSLVGDQLDEVRAIIQRIFPETGRSELVDPYTADAAWLRWLAQFVGIPRAESVPLSQLRPLIALAADGWSHGTMPRLIKTIRSLLVDVGWGVPYVAVDRDSSDPFRLTIRTAREETPQGGAELIAQVIAAGAKAAGILLMWVVYEASWDVIETRFPTWDAVEAANPWAHIEAAHPVG